MKKPLIITISVVAAIALTSPIWSLPYRCEQEKKALVNSKQAAIDDIDKIALLGESPAQKAKVEAFSRCGQLTGDDSVNVDKTYRITMNGGKAIDAIRGSLANAGYKITSEYFGMDRGCELAYRGRASKDGVRVNFAASQDNIKDPDCTNIESFGATTEAYFREHDIDYASISLTDR